MNLRKLSFSKFQVISFVEYLILNNEASSEEEEFYYTYKWSNKLNKFTYKKLVSKLKLQYLGE